MNDHDTTTPSPKLERPTNAPRLYGQEGKGFEATVHAHYFVAGSDWLVTEYDPTDDLAFGWACLSGDRQNAEFGYVSMAELEEVRVPLRVRVNGRETLGGAILVERDEQWTPMTLTEAIEELDRRQGRVSQT
jgi:hypothetical protein